MVPRFRSLAPVTIAICACTRPDPVALNQDVFTADRQRMVADQIAARDVRDARVLAAMRDVPRHLFVPPERQSQAYDDAPLPIGYAQTISQPYIVALRLDVTSSLTSSARRVLRGA